MRCISPVAATAVLLIAYGRAPADDTAPPPINTDRPAVTDSSIVVPVGSLQFENGFTEAASQGIETLDASETLLRFGVAAKTELRFTAPDYYGRIAASGGFGDLAIGVKQQLGPAAGFDVSLIGTLSMPTGARAISSHGYDPSLQLPWSRSISSNWTVAGMLSLYWPTQNGRRDLTGESTLLFDRQLTKRWDAFAEYAGDFAQEGGPRHLAHIGTAYKVTPQQQLDFHFGAGLSARAVDHFIGVGYSCRIRR
ncbi:MAG: transporter [Bryobacteraceae bacterium]